MHLHQDLGLWKTRQRNPQYGCAVVGGVTTSQKHGEGHLTFCVQTESQYYHLIARDTGCTFLVCKIKIIVVNCNVMLTISRPYNEQKAERGRIPTCPTVPMSSLLTDLKFPCQLHFLKAFWSHRHFNSNNWYPLGKETNVPAIFTSDKLHHNSLKALSRMRCLACMQTQEHQTESMRAIQIRPGRAQCRRRGAEQPEACRFDGLPFSRRDELLHSFQLFNKH